MESGFPGRLSDRPAGYRTSSWFVCIASNAEGSMLLVVALDLASPRSRMLRIGRFCGCSSRDCRKMMI